MVGLLTANEILRYHTTIDKPELIGEIMSRDFLTISQGMNISELAELFGETRAECALVLEGKYLVGLVAEHDIVQAVNAMDILK